jgi:hypothetical protein
MGGGNSETYNLDAEQGGGYNYDETAAELQAFSDKAVIKYHYSLLKNISSLFYYDLYVLRT